ncbi:MAG: hypothetical protein MJ241_03525 [Bacilli bacterium]|nr:hypothetical protein [Bacilli bacterium]
MVIKNKKSNSIGKAQTRELSREQKKKEKENDMEMMLLIYAASVIV